MKDIYTYKINNSLYINLTNRCTNRCAFCVRDQSASYEGYSLWLTKEPTAQEVIALLGDVKSYDEIVFCGYGEPTERLEEIKEISKFVHERGGKTRMNTNGHGSVINGRKIALELKGLLDGINISLNSPTEEGYEKLCRPQIEKGYGALLQFAKDCKESGLNCWFSVVDCIGQEQVKMCQAIADGVGIPLRVREMIDNTQK